MWEFKKHNRFGRGMDDRTPSDMERMLLLPPPLGPRYGLPLATAVHTIQPSNGFIINREFEQLKGKRIPLEVGIISFDGKKRFSTKISPPMPLQGLREEITCVGGAPIQYKTLQKFYGEIREEKNQRSQIS